MYDEVQFYVMNKLIRNYFGLSKKDKNIFLLTSIASVYFTR